MKTLKEIDEQWLLALKELEEARLEYETLMSQPLPTSLSLQRLPKEEIEKKRAEEEAAKQQILKALSSAETKIKKAEERLGIIRNEFYEGLQREQKPQSNPFELMDKCRKATAVFITKGVENLAFMELIAIPTDMSQIDINEIRKALKVACVDYRGWPYLFYLESSKVSPQRADDRIYAVNNEPFFGRLEFDYWAFYYRTGIFYSRNLTVYSSLSKPDKFSYFDEAKILGEAIIAIGRLYSSLGFHIASEITLAVRYEPTKNMVAIDGTIFESQYSNRFSDSKLTHEIIRPLGDCLNKPAHVASDIIFYLLGKIGYWGGYGHDGFVADIEKHLKIPKS